MDETSDPFGQALVALASWLLLACAAWAALLLAAAVVEVATSGRLRATTWVGCPVALRRVLLAGLGAVLAGGAVPAHATHASPGARTGGDSGQVSLPVPARPVGHVASPGRPTVVQVCSGDSLWRIAEARLGPRAPAAAVATLVDRLHTRNRAVIGADPDRLHPGQRLVVPPLLRSHAHHLEESPCAHR